MKFFKNKTEWQKWAKEVQRSQASAISIPTEFPCFAYLVVQSFGYEEEDARYLYESDIAEMQSRLATK